MELHSLRAFYISCKYKSFTKAGKELFVSQSAISIQVRKLEKELNIQLIERDSKNFKLTYAGKKLFKMTDDIFTAIAKMENEIVRVINDQNTKIIVGATHNVGEPLLPIIVKEYLALNPNIKFELLIKNSNSLWGYLKRGEVDLILTDEMIPDDSDVEYEDTDNYPFVVAAPPSINEIHELKNIYLLKRESANIDKYIEIFKKKNRISTQINDMTVTGSIETIKNLIKMGMGYSIIPYFCVYNEVINGDIKVMHRFKETYTKFKIIYLKETKDKLLVGQFIKFIREFDIKKPLGDIK